jgi:hypothetical protein
LRKRIDEIEMDFTMHYVWEIDDLIRGGYQWLAL